MPRGDNDVCDTAKRIIVTISCHCDHIFQRLREKSHKLAAYSRLLRDLPTVDVATSVDYQTRYNGFYQVRYRSQQWRAAYYGLLERKKVDQKVTFEEVIRELHKLTERVEPSFTSKLVATIRPQLPVYDAEVRRHMEVEVPQQYVPSQGRIDKWLTEYERLTNVANCAVKSVEFKKLRGRFDNEFTIYRAFTEIKKLDLMLWQCRPNERGAADA